MKNWVASGLATLYGRIVQCSQSSYNAPGRVQKVSARVISVGNITWGGTGKTPLVISLAKYLASQGKKVAVLTRGYGQDEVEELKRKISYVPILVGRDRIRKAREAIEKYQSEVLILDDGFQHLRLHRDVDIVNINATQPFGPGGLIPKGTLREPLENLKRADVFVLSKSNIGSKNLHWIRQRLQSIKPDAVIFEAIHRPLNFVDLNKNRFVPLDKIKGRHVAAISAIEDPYSFEKMIENLGAQIDFAARFNDHHHYSPRDIAVFLKRCRDLNIRTAVTTRKDLFRLLPALRAASFRHRDDFRFWVLDISFQVQDEENFLRRCFNS